MRFRSREYSDAEVVRAVLQGRSQRFALLVDRYKNLVYSTLLARVRQQDEADDLAQETFLKAFRHLDSLEDPRKFGPWVRQIAAHQALNFLRDRSRRQVSAEELDLPLPERPDQVFAVQEERQRIWQAIGQLSEDHREIILLFYMEEYSLPQIAAFLELQPDSAKMRLRRARETLREQLEEEFDRKVRQAVQHQQKKRDKKFTQKIMSALPLVPWSAKVAPLAVARLGWGFLGLAALTEVGLISLMVGWLPSREPRQAQVVEEQVIRLEWVPPEAPGPAASYFGDDLLGSEGRALQEEALRQGKGGRLEWGFDQDAQGWQARIAPYDRGPRGTLPTQVSDGVWRVSLGPYQPGRVPAIELVSPELGYESGLFDQLELRVRLVGQTPAQGSFVLNWTNPLNRLFPGFEPRFLERRSDAQIEADRGKTRYSRFATWNPGGKVTYGRQWQNLAMDNLDRRPQTRWTGNLVDLRAILVLTDTRGEEIPPSLFPQALEIDRIVLGNANRTQVQDLPLPEGAKTRPAGQWLDLGSFYPLGQTGLKWPILGDLDGDGDLDLVVGFEQTDQAWQVSQGLIKAFNDGKGRFALGGKAMLEEPKEGEKQQSYSIVLLSGADLDGDGDLDLVVHRGLDTVLLQNAGEGIFAEARTWKDRFCAGVADLEGDGDEDIALVPYEKATYDLPMEARTWGVVMQLNDGSGYFREQKIESPATGQGWFPRVLDDYNGDGRAELVWQQISEHKQEAKLLVCAGYEEGAWKQQETIPYQILRESLQYALWTALLYLGDLGADSQWDLGLPQGAYTEGRGTNSFGIEVVGSRLPATPMPWLPRQVHLRLGFPNQPPLVPQTWDLDQDGLADPLFLDFNYRRGVQLLVLRGQRGVWPVEEGGYPLPSEPSGWAAGDVDNDGDVDVVVSVEGVEGAGLCVFRNQTGKQVANR
jgi:RNA polymerase sigma-70 factor (ECF subfamily)